jgi:hypothetical protein
MGKPTVKELKEAIPGSGGIISTIAKRVGCDWSTAKKYIDASPVLSQMYQNERESILDMAEGVLFKNIREGDSQDAKWVLSRLGKDRGFSERQEVTGAEGGPIKVKGYAVFSPDDWENDKD